MKAQLKQKQSKKAGATKATEATTQVEQATAGTTPDDIDVSQLDPAQIAQAQADAEALIQSKKQGNEATPAAQEQTPNQVANAVDIQQMDMNK